MDWSNPGAFQFLQRTMRMAQETPDILENAMERLGDVMNPDYHGDKKKLIKSHRNEYKKCEKMRHMENHVVSLANPFIAKKEFDSSTCSDWNLALPIPVSILQVNTVHHGRILRGTLIEKPYVIQGVHCLLEDRSGDVVKVCFYPPEIEQDGMHFNDKWKVGERMFPKGSTVEIFEPFFKSSMDGTLLVRVDNMADVKTDFSNEPMTPKALNEEGKKYVAALHFDEAILSYNDAKKCMDEEFPLYKILFQNLALVHIHMNHYETALHYAIGAIFMNPQSAPKGYFRAAIALEKLHSSHLALQFCIFAQEQNPSACKDPIFKSLLERLESKHSGFSQSRETDSWMKEKALIKHLSSDPDVSIETNIEDCPMTPDELKKRGNDFVGKSDHIEAKKCYEKALYKLESAQEIPLTTFLTNMSLCYFKTGKYHESFVNASFAVTLQPKNKKAHYRRIASILNLEMIDYGKVCFDYGKLVLQEDADCLTSLEERLMLVPSLQKSPRHKPQSRFQEYKPEYAPHQMVEHMNMMIEMSGLGNKMLRDIPPFHITYPKLRQWPSQSDNEKCLMLLNQAYSLGRSDGHRLVLENMPTEIVNRDYLIKRLGTNDPDRVKWLLSANCSDVFFRERVPYGGGNAHHSFGNVAQQPQTMTKGKTHVSIGFADLQEVVLCKLSETTPTNPLQPLKWVGYDKSPYVVAKTMVIIEMLKEEKTQAQSIVQVWYSATWSSQTLQAYRSALKIVLSKKRHDAIPPSVQAYLIHWYQHDVSLRESRGKWMENHECTWVDEICNWKQEQDYLAMCTYAMTGELYYHDLTVGSVVMFALPENEKVVNDENVFEVVNLVELILHYERMNGDCENCVQAITTMLESKVQTLKNRIQHNQVTLEVYCEEIYLNNESLIHKIRNDLEPYSMSWSNVCDYISTKDFHEIARRCSIGNETIHYGYSMNWPMEVKGTFIGDYCLAKESDAMKKFVKDILLKAEESLEILWQNITPESKKYLTLPPQTNPLNILDWYIRACNKPLHLEWFQAFTKASSCEILEHMCDVSLSPIFQFNHRTNSIITFYWTYDSKINLMKQEHSYENV